MSGGWVPTRSLQQRKYVKLTGNGDDGGPVVLYAETEGSYPHMRQISGGVAVRVDYLNPPAMGWTPAHSSHVSIAWVA